MWADENSFIHAWDAMLFEAKETCIRIFVADFFVDSVASIKIIGKLLRHSSITYSVLTVRTWADLKEKMQCAYPMDARVSTKPETVLLLNCGGTSDILRMNTPPMRFFIIDAHRPIYHGNLLSTNKEVVVFLSLDYDNDIINIINDIDKIGKKQGRGNIISQKFFHQCGIIQNENDQFWFLSKLARKENLIKQINSKKENLINNKTYEDTERLLYEYYQKGSYMGSPVSKIVHRISYCLQKSDIEDLWYAIVGTTDFFVHNMMTFSNYKKFYDEFIALMGYLRYNEKYCNTEGCFNCDLDNKKIQPAIDYRLPMLRHWTLLDSFMNSTYTSARLQTYSDNGCRVMKSLLAKVGLPLREYKKLWQDLSPKLRFTLPTRLIEYAKAFNIPDIQFPSFSFACSYTNFMATDIVYGVTAILENNQDSKLRLENNNFWAAFNALELTNELNIRESIYFSKELHCALISIAKTALVRKEVQFLGVVRVYFLSQTRAEYDHAALRSNPSCLKKLNFFIQDCYTQQTGCSIPSILVTYPDTEDFCLIVVSSGRDLNTFISTLIRSAELAGIDYTVETFDVSVLKVQSNSISDLFDHLQKTSTE